MNRSIWPLLDQIYYKFIINVLIIHFQDKLKYIYNNIFITDQLLILGVIKMAAYVCIEDYEKHALEHLTPSIRDYYKGGAGEEYSVKWNREAFKK